MYQNCLRQQPHAATYITSPSAAATPSPLLYDRGGPYCYPRNSPPGNPPPQSTAVYQGSIYTQPNGHLAELTSPDCLGPRGKPPVHGGGLQGDVQSDHAGGSTSPSAGTVYWTHYQQRGSYPVVAPSGASSPPTTYYDPNRRVMSSPHGGGGGGGLVQWSAGTDAVQFGGGHPTTVNDGQSLSVDGYTAYRASAIGGGGDLGYARPTAAARGGGGGGEDGLSQQLRHHHHQQQHPSAAAVYAASHQTSLKAVSAEASRSGTASAAYQRSTPAAPGGQRVSTGSSASAAAVQGHSAAPPFDWMRKHAYPTVPNSGKTRTKDKYRIVYTELQKVELEKEFLYNQYITIQRKAELAVAIGLSDRQVKIWFQNRRAKDRKQKRKRPDHHGNHQHHQQPTAATASSTAKTISSSAATAAAGTTRNNTSLLSSSPSSSSLSSSSSSSLVLKQEMMMRCGDDEDAAAVKLESSSSSNFVDQSSIVARPSVVANGNGGYDVMPIC